MLIAKGFHVIFKMDDGRTVRPPAGHALLHDEDGRDWPRCSGLVIPIKRVTREPVRSSSAKSYFGHEPVGGRVVLPPRTLSEWQRVGVIDEVLYTRRRPRGLPSAHRADYYHPIDKGTATLYRRGRHYRMELGSGCRWNWRGIITP